MPRTPQPTSAVDGYVTTTLLPQLRALGLMSQQRALIAGDVRQRLLSLLGRWDDSVFRATALLLGTEDATFYQPAEVPLEIRALVAVGVRNSMLEDITASRPSEPALRGVRERLRDAQVPAFTGRAVMFFAQHARQHGDWGVPPVTGDGDLFGALAQTYPLAWERLRLLATSPAKEHDLAAPEEGLFSMPPPPRERRNAIAPIVLSGYDPAIDEPLRARLDAIQAGTLEMLFAPTFKGLTRNPAKLLYAIETIIAAGGTFCTLNYLIRRDYCARREMLVRPPHEEDEILPALRIYDGLVPRHRTAIQHAASVEGAAE